MTRQWYRFANKADDPKVVELLIFDDIGKSWWNDDAITAKTFMEDLKALADSVTTIVVRVNSLGGDVFEAVAIANALRDQVRTKGRTVNTIVDGIAASAASIVIMAGETIQIADNGIVMVHDPFTIEIGNAAQMRKTADALDKIRDTSILATYKWHSKLSDDELRALMSDETWMDADEAIENGFATEKVEGLKAAASIDRRALANLKVPEKFKARVDALLTPPLVAPTPAPADVITRACADAGLDLAFANALITEKVQADQVTARVAAEKTTRATAADAERTARVAAEARATEITALCTAAKQPTLAADFIAGQMPVEKVRHALATIAAAIDNKDIDGSLTPSGVAAKDSWKQAFARATHSIFAR